jgi:hypothetical protein
MFNKTIGDFELEWILLFYYRPQSLLSELDTRYLSKCNENVDPNVLQYASTNKRNKS